MRCLAVMVDIDHPRIDNVILWGRDDGQYVAMAYLDGQVVMSRPLEAPLFDDAVREVREAFGIGDSRVTRIREWVQPI